jgi:hypothetical protein
MPQDKNVFETYIVDNHGYRLHVNAASKHIGGNEHLCIATSELVDDAVTILAFQSTAQLRDLMALCNHALLELFGGPSGLRTLVMTGESEHVR